MPALAHPSRPVLQLLGLLLLSCARPAQPQPPPGQPAPIVLQPRLPPGPATAPTPPPGARKDQPANSPAAREPTWAFEQMVEGEYRLPPEPVRALLTESSPPAPLVHRASRRLALVQREKTLPLERLARLNLGLAGLRIESHNHTLVGRELVTQIELVSLDPGKQRYQLLPPDGALLDDPEFSPSGRYLSASVVWPDRVGVVIFDLVAQTETLLDEELSAVWGNPCQWVSDEQLLCRLFPRPLPPLEGDANIGPNVTEHVAGTAPARTYRYLLQSKRDDELFERHFSSTSALLGARGNIDYLLIPPAIVWEQALSPDGQYVLHVTLERPFSRVVAASRFPRRVRILSRSGKTLHEVALPDGGAWPTRGVPLGPQGFRWDPTRPATLVYVDLEATPQGQVSRLMTLDAPFREPAHSPWNTTGILGAAEWTTEGTLLLPEHDRGGNRAATWVRRGDRFLRVEGLGTPPAPLQDALRENGNRGPVLETAAGEVFLSRPADATGATQRLLRHTLKPGDGGVRIALSERNQQKLLAVLDPARREALVSREALRQEPNYFVVRADSERPVTASSGKYAALSAARRIPLRYVRADGQPLSASLYLPTTFPQSGCRATVLWIYPGNEPTTPLPESDAHHPFWDVSGPSRLALLLRGYALLDQPSMPISDRPGQGAEYLTQLEQSAVAAVAELRRLGLCSADRLAVVGRSYGAFNTANLLVHTDLFRTGIAISGAYNRTLTPFGFQFEQRNFWEAAELYTQISPFFHVEKLTEPLLLLHGEEDENPGTPPLQSERFFQALAGMGIPARYVSLPLEGHKIRGHESVLHASAEMLDWLDRHFPLEDRASAPAPQR